MFRRQNRTEDMEKRTAILLENIYMMVRKRNAYFLTDTLGLKKKKSFNVTSVKPNTLNVLLMYITFVFFLKRMLTFALNCTCDFLIYITSKLNNNNNNNLNKS